MRLAQRRREPAGGRAQGNSNNNGSEESQYSAAGRWRQTRRPLSGAALESRRRYLKRQRAELIAEHSAEHSAVAGAGTGIQLFQLAGNSTGKHQGWGPVA